MATEREIFERRMRLLNEQDANHRHIRERWLAQERKNLSSAQSGIVRNLAGEEGLEPVSAVEFSGEGLDGGADAMVQLDVVASQLHDDGHDSNFVNSGLCLEKGQSVLSHSSLPVGVGASQGRARAEALEDASASPRPDAPNPSTTTPWSNPMRKLLDVCRRLDQGWPGDVIALFFLILLAPAVLFIGALLDGGM